ncbi:oxidoreductase [Aureococcus anophagefferens]|nr:oxidoreductase [Aureococcus anophagefferens]
MGSPANKKASSRKSRCATGHTVTTTSAGSDATAAAPTGWQATIALNDGTHIPQLGLGVYCAANGGETERAVLHALRSGYRHVDTAEIYRNETDVGKALEKFFAEQAAVARGDVYVTTKFFPQSGRGYDAVREALRGSLKKLRLTYVDLYLVHSPNTRSLRLEQWKAMEDPEGKTPLIQWCLQRGYVVIPKSVKPARIEENNIPADQAPISEADMATLDGDGRAVTGWDPTKKP